MKHNTEIFVECIFAGFGFTIGTVLALFMFSVLI